MADIRYNEFVEKLIQKTKDNELHWDYLDNKSDIYIPMRWCRESSNVLLPINKEYVPTFNKEKSFFATDTGYKIVLLVNGNDPADLYVIPSTYKRVLKLDATEYGALITRLLNLVQGQFPDSEDYVDMILKKHSTD